MTASMNTGNTAFLNRDVVYSAQLKEILEDELLAMRYVNWLSGFPDGDTFTIPSIGKAVAYDYQEGDAVQYRALDTGEFNFQITEYLASGHSISKKAMQDLFYAEQLMSKFVPEQERAILERLESDILGLQSQQTAAATNSINGRKHRYVATGTNDVLALADVAYANLALNVANVPATGRVAIVGPETAYTLETLSNLVSVSNNPMWEGIVSTGIATGMKFIKNVYGFDVYMSNRLDTIGTETLETVDISGYNANLFFSADAEPFVGAWRQMPMVEQKWDMDFQEMRFVTTCRYGVDLYRPESLVVVMTDPTAV